MISLIYPLQIPYIKLRKRILHVKQAFNDFQIIAVLLKYFKIKIIKIINFANVKQESKFNLFINFCLLIFLNLNLTPLYLLILTYVVQLFFLNLIFSLEIKSRFHSHLIHIRILRASIKQNQLGHRSIIELESRSRAGN